MKYKNLTQILNNITPNTIRWCTPSIHLNMNKVKDIYQSDMSVSFERLGYPLEPSGFFLDAYKKAAKAYGSERTLFTVNGSTGSNFIVLRTLAKQIPNLRILAQRNIHKSILHACQDYRINLLFIDKNIDSHLQIFLPNTIDEIVQAIEKTKPHVLLITNPTYEGLTLNLKKLIKIVRKINPSIIIFVDEAWGSHLSFSDNLPHSAIQSGADICVQSTHKQGGALQQTSMIHWSFNRINTQLLIDSYRNLSTTSPSYTLLASLDATREYMEINGLKCIKQSLKIAKSLKKELNSIKGFKVVSLQLLRNKHSGVFNKDNTKIILDVSKSNYTGYTLSRLLEIKHKIIVEKCNATSIVFLVPFQATQSDVIKTINAIKSVIKNYDSEKNHIPIPMLELPQNTPRILELSEVTKLTQNETESIPLNNAVGRISAENIIPYPPGIPTTIQGEEFTKQAIYFYKNLRNYPNSHVLANDITLDTILVVK